MVNHLVNLDDSNRKESVELFYFVRDSIKYIPHIYAEKHNVLPVSFDGILNAKFPAFDFNNDKFMEYGCYHGSFASIPSDKIPGIWLEKYGANIVNILCNKFPSRV